MRDAEADLMRQIQVALSSHGARAFRNNVGTGWVGKLLRGPAPDGQVVLDNARPLHAGLCVGSSDLIGWRTIRITPDLVGHDVAIFSTIEVKTSHGRTTLEQRAWLDAVAAAGGISILARSVEDATRGIDGYFEALRLRRSRHGTSGTGS